MENKTKKQKNVKKIKNTISAHIYDYLRRVGLEKADLVEATKIAKKIKPNTAFNKYHLSWYKNKFVENQEKVD